MGIDFWAVGRHEESLGADMEAVRLRCELSKTDPSIHARLAWSLHRLGVKFQVAGRNEEALVSQNPKFNYSCL